METAGRGRAVAVAAALLFSIMAAGCGQEGPNGVADETAQSEPAEDRAPSAEPVSSPTQPYATPTPEGEPVGDGADPGDQIRSDLKTRVVQTAGVSGPADASCNPSRISGRVDQTVACTVVYADLEVDYTVEVVGGSGTFSWSAYTERSVLTSAGVRAAYWERFGADSDELRCDEMPEAELVEINTASDYSCYRYSDDEWVGDAVVLTDGAIEFEESE